MTKGDLPAGLFEVMMPKYPEVSIWSRMMSSRIFFVQSSPTQSRQVGLVKSEEDSPKNQDFHNNTY